MARFTSTVVNKVDKKGRVSVPATFRAALDQMGGNVVYLRPDTGTGCLEGLTEAFMSDIERRIDVLAINSEEREGFEQAYFGASHRLTVDPEGRIILPRELIDFAEITEQASFVGLNTRFQIWHPDRLAEHRKNNVDRLKGKTLPAAPRSAQ